VVGSILGRFVSADTVIPPGVQGLDRYGYVNNNPLRYTDPSGHCVVGGHEMPDDTPACRWQNKSSLPAVAPSATPAVEPWKEYSGYDPVTDSIPNWGDNTADEDWRQERAELVWSWMCTAGGWWGSGCPGAKDLAAWLLMMEGGPLFNVNTTGSVNEAIRAMVGLFQYLFDDADGITPQDLSRFTAFFNPKQRDGGVFGADDWALIQTKPADLFYKKGVNKYWDWGPYYHNNRVVDRWWSSTERILATGQFKIWEAKCDKKG
jgi:hypothetical protein